MHRTLNVDNQMKKCVYIRTHHPIFINIEVLTVPPSRRLPQRKMEKLAQIVENAEISANTSRRKMLKVAWTIPAIVALGSIPAFGQDASGGPVSSTSDP